MNRIIVLIIGVFFYQNSFSQDNSIYRKLSPAEYRNDLLILTTSLKESLMELYMYQDSVTFEKKINDLNSRTDSITIKDFYTEIKKLFAPIGSDHMKVFFQKEVENDNVKTKRIFPLEVRFLNEKVYCFYNYQDNDIENGDQIISVNGNKMTDAVRTILGLTNSGGFIQDSKKWIFESLGFSEKYYLFIDTSQTFNVEYMKKGENNIKTINIKGGKREELENESNSTKYNNLHNNNSFPNPYGLKIENGVAIMNIEQFYENISEKQFNEFYKKSFREIETQKVEYLIIDVRRNLGGWQRHGYNLMEYFTPIEFSPIESVWFKSNSFSFLHFTNMKAKDLNLNKLEKSGRYYKQKCFNWLTESTFKPKEKYFYSGKVFVITNEGTSSAACFFTNAINTFNDSVVFVGRESDAVSSGASSGFMPILTLPNSKLNIRLALAYFKAVSKPNLPYGRGLIPDFIVERDLSATDKETDFTIKLINQERKK